jgi:hypothetical protein
MGPAASSPTPPRVVRTPPDWVGAGTLRALTWGSRTPCPNGLASRRGVSSALISTECLRTLDRLRLRVKLDDVEVARRRAKILDLITSVEIVEIDAAVLDRAAQPMPTELGTLDAIHLATALFTARLLVFLNVGE